METIITGHSMSLLRTFFLSPWARAQRFCADYMWLQDMRPHSLNQFFSLILFNKDWFLKHKLRSAVEHPWTYKVEYVHTPHIPLLVFMRMRISICSVTRRDDTWDQPGRQQIFSQSHLCVPTGRRWGQSRHTLVAGSERSVSPPQIIFLPSPLFFFVQGARIDFISPVKPLWQFVSHLACHRANDW